MNLVGMSTSGRSTSTTGLARRMRTETGSSAKPTRPSRTMAASQLDAIFFCRATLTLPVSASES